MTSVGTNPTFEVDKKLRIETLLLDYSGDIYGRTLALDFLEWIRAQQTYPDADSLVHRIREDIEVARSYLRSRGEPA